jgi:hypothetical protein
MFRCVNLHHLPMDNLSTLLCVNISLPGKEFDYVNFLSRTSVFDSEIIVFWPSFKDFMADTTYKGKRTFHDDKAFELREHITHWNSQLQAALREGKTVFYYLTEPEDVFLDTGNRQYSGTGRNQTTTRMVDSANSYEVLPVSLRPTVARGNATRATKDLGLLAAYWKLCSEYSYYEAYLPAGKLPNPALTVGRKGDSVSGVLRVEAGHVVFLPPMDLPKTFTIRVKATDNEEDADEEQDAEEGQEYWSSDALAFGKRLAAHLRGIDKTLKSGTDKSIPPDWATPEAYPLAKERALTMSIDAANTELKQAQERLAKLEDEKNQAGILRYLLYEKGKPLETAILEVLRLLGFSVEQLKDGDSEFDAIFVAAEGRFLGEVEGKDNKAVNIDKLSQLERNIQEDFGREAVTEYAHGVLFGNSYRLQPPEKRPEPFTAKCLTGAKRANVSLIDTHGLFDVAKYLTENDDKLYAERCRKAILDGKGTVVKFPAPPRSESKTT